MYGAFVIAKSSVSVHKLTTLWHRYETKIPDLDAIFFTSVELLLQYWEYPVNVIKITVMDTFSLCSFPCEFSARTRIREYP